MTYIMKDGKYPLHLILVSQSPRRKTLLKKWGFQFENQPVHTKEDLNTNLDLDSAIQDIAQKKSQALKASGYLKNKKNYLLLSADTLVVVRGCVFGKPKSKQEAIAFLKKLSGQTHEVKTGLCLWDYTDKKATDIETTKISFKPLDIQDICSYIETGDPMDKAGAYGIQSVKDKFVSSMEGAMDNVLGLPYQLFKTLLKENAWHVINEDLRK